MSSYLQFRPLVRIGKSSLAYLTILCLNNFQFHICFFNFYEDLVSSANAHAYRASQGVGGEEKKCISEASFSGDKNREEGSAEKLS